MDKNSFLYRVLNAQKHLLITTFLGIILYFFMTPITVRLSWTVPVMQCLLILMFTVSIYIPFWEYGDRDNNLVSFGHRNKDLLLGLKIGCVAALPYLLASVFLVLYRLGVASWTFLIYRIVNIEFIYIIEHLIDVENAFQTPWSSVLICIILPFYSVIVSEVGYLLGYKEISIKEKLVYKTKK